MTDTIPQSAREYLSIIGRKGGLKIKKLRGKAYFKELRRKATQKRKSQQSGTYPQQELDEPPVGDKISI